MRFGGEIAPSLSAKLMRPTIPETEGVIDRERLLGISGRSRKVQLELARVYGIEEYETPSGGCLFTDVNISRRVHDLFHHHEDADALDVYLLAIGRHLRISDVTKIIVGRNEKENEALEKQMAKADMFCLPEFKGPAIYVKGATTRAEKQLIGRVLLYYGKNISGEGVMRIFKHGIDNGTMTITSSEDAWNIEGMMI